MTRREAAEEAVGGTWMKMGGAMILDVPGDGIAAICAGHGWAVVGGASGPETGDEAIDLASDAVVLHYVARVAVDGRRPLRRL